MDKDRINRGICEERGEFMEMVEAKLRLPMRKSDKDNICINQPGDGRNTEIMKYLGKGRIITDGLIYLDRGDIVDVYKYEEGEEREDGTTSLDQGAADFATDHGGPDLYAEEVELLEVSTSSDTGAITSPEKGETSNS